MTAVLVTGSLVIGAVLLHQAVKNLRTPSWRVKDGTTVSRQDTPTRYWLVTGFLFVVGAACFIVGGLLAAGVITPDDLGKGRRPRRF